MTSRSRRKRRITARTFTTGIRYSFAALLAGTTVSATAQSPTAPSRTARQAIPTAAPPVVASQPPMAFQPTTAANGGAMLRPVPRHGTVAPPPQTPHQPQHPGWDLRWRPSSQVASSQVAPSQAVAVPANHSHAVTGPTTTSAPHVAGKLQLAERAPDLRRLDDPSGADGSVEPVVWMGKPRRSDPFATPSQLQVDGAPSGQSAADYFEHPFGEDPASSNQPSTTNALGVEADGEVNPNGLILPTQANQELVPPGPDQELPSPKPSRMEQELVPPSPDELDTDNQLRGPIELPQQSPERSNPADEQGFSLPAPQTPPRDASPAPSIRQERRIETPAAPRVAEPIQPTPIEVLPQDADPTLQDRERNDAQIESLPTPRADQGEDLSAPQQETFPPFPGREPSEADLRDRERLNQSREREDEYRQDSSRYGGGTDFLDPESFTCEDFRQRIAAQTIDKISLDVSPPFRPDEFDVQRYQQLKADFDEKQVIRRWVSLDGRPLATGRLRDLAYEKAVIETEEGSLVQLPVNRLSEGDIAYITENWGLPRECLIEQVAYQPRQWAPMTMTWKASNLCHNPLYFEDVNLERYGHTRGPVLEPLVQTAHFFGNVLVLPYKMGVHAPHECQYALGYYRPGDCAPWIKPPVPISARGAIAQAATMSGLFWLIP